MTRFSAMSLFAKALGGHQSQYRIQHGQLFLAAERCGFAGGGAHHDPGHVLGQQVADQPVQAGKVDGAILERRDHGNPDTLKR